MKADKKYLDRQLFKKLYLRNLHFHTIIIAVASIFIMSIIFVPMGYLTKKMSKTLRVYDEGYIYDMDDMTLFAISTYNTVNADNLSDFIKSSDTVYREKVYDLFVEGHTPDDYAFVAPKIKLNKRELSREKYMYKTSGKLNYELKEGRWFERTANEVVIYGNGSLKLGDTFEINNVEYTVVGILKNQVPSGYINAEKEKSLGEIFIPSRTNFFHKEIIFNPNAKGIFEKTDGVFAIVFDKTKYTKEELDEINAFGNVRKVEDYTQSIESPTYGFLRYIFPILAGGLFVIALYILMGQIREKASEIIMFYASYNAPKSYVRNRFIAGICMDIIIGMIIGIQRMDSKFDALNYKWEVFLAIVCVCVVAYLVIKKYVTKRYDNECLALDKMNYKEKRIYKELTLYDNLVLVFIIKLCMTKDRAQMVAEQYVKTFLFNEIKSVYVAAIDEKYHNSIELAMKVAKTRSNTVIMNEDWPEKEYLISRIKKEFGIIVVEENV
ncbi:MAG: ABC transporter permease [Lachnospira sp.]|nr:ABC transporter permease [Lachnospira sp.]